MFAFVAGSSKAKSDKRSGGAPASSTVSQRVLDLSLWRRLLKSSIAALMESIDCYHDTVLLIRVLGRFASTAESLIYVLVESRPVNSTCCSGHPEHVMKPLSGTSYSSSSKRSIACVLLRLLSIDYHAPEDSSPCLSTACRPSTHYLPDLRFCSSSIRAISLRKSPVIKISMDKGTTDGPCPTVSRSLTFSVDCGNGKRSHHRTWRTDLEYSGDGLIGDNSSSSSMSLFGLLLIARTI